MDLLDDWVSTKAFEPVAIEEFTIKPSNKYQRPYKIQRDPEAKAPKYWTLPLSNFLCEFRQNPDELKIHPLRKNKNSKIVRFNYDGEDGFIEPLTDYKERENDLRNGRASYKITAVMVGSIGPKNIHKINWAGLDEWFPFTFLPLLGFAVGNDISAPCVEIRDDNGRLARRFVIELENPAPFSQGHLVINEGIDLGIGHLLSLLPPEHRGDTFLRVVLKHVARGGLACHDIEEKMSYIIRGIDCLGENYGLGAPQLTKYLDPHQKSKVKDAIRIAAKQVEIEADNAKKAGQSIQCSCLRRIAGRTINAGNTDRNFGLEVIELLKRYGLHDADIVADYYKNSSDYSKDWISILNDYRGKPMHPGYFDFENKENKYDFEKVYVVARHLHDILIRIVLKELKYDKMYRPAIFVPKDVTLSEYALDGFDANWVRTDTPAIALGYITEEEKEIVQKREEDHIKRLKRIFNTRVSR